MPGPRPCRKCENPITIASTPPKTRGGPRGSIPLDARAPCYILTPATGKAERAPGNIQVSHFATCAAAAHFTRSKTAAAELLEAALNWREDRGAPFRKEAVSDALLEALEEKIDGYAAALKGKEADDAED